MTIHNSIMVKVTILALYKLSTAAIKGVASNAKSDVHQNHAYMKYGYLFLKIMHIYHDMKRKSEVMMETDTKTASNNDGKHAKIFLSRPH